jgi:hypothetical protein
MELVMQLQSMESLLALGSGLDLEPGTKGNCLVSGNECLDAEEDTKPGTAGEGLVPGSVGDSLMNRAVGFL